MKDYVFGSLKRWWVECRGVIYFFVLVVLPVKSVLADWNWVPTGSMNPTILEGDMIFVNKAAYDLRVPFTMQRVTEWAQPERGDIVVAFAPQDGTRVVKRVIGVPGDEIEMRNNVLTINGERADYSELSAEVTAEMLPALRERSVFAREDFGDGGHAVMSMRGVWSGRRNFEKVRVPEGEYFVMGDNRDNSLDSRVYGFMERERIVGKATGVIVSFDKLDRYQPRMGRFFSGLE
ncbi:MAG: signal peptidase I [Verrucomicrobiota bacterium]